MVEMDHLPVKKISYAVTALGLLYFVMHAEGLFGCCIAHFKTPIPVAVFKRFTIQSSGEMCEIDAIIFSTFKGRKVCTDPKDAWVKRAMRFLRKKKKKNKKKKNKTGLGAKTTELSSLLPYVITSTTPSCQPNLQYIDHNTKPPT